MNDIKDFKDAIYMWPSTADFGRDIGVPEVSARAMRRRNSVSVKYWSKMIEAAKIRGIPVTNDLLLQFVSKKKKRKTKNN